MLNERRFNRLENLCKSWMFFAIVFASYVACSASSVHAYELKKTTAGMQVRWSRSVITLSVDEKLEAALGANEVHSALAMATDAWRGLPGVPDIIIGKARPPSFSENERHNGVYLVTEWPYEPDQLAVTLVTYDVTGNIHGVDMLINAKHRFAVLAEGSDHAQDAAQAEEHDLGALFTHELGHVLGLGESPTDHEATMWRYLGAGEVHQRSITKDDEDGVIAAYSGEAPAAAGGCSQASAVGAVRTRSPLALLSLPGLLLLLITRRRAARVS